MGMFDDEDYKVYYDENAGFADDEDSEEYVPGESLDGMIQRCFKKDKSSTNPYLSGDTEWTKESPIANAIMPILLIGIAIFVVVMIVIIVGGSSGLL